MQIRATEELTPTEAPAATTEDGTHAVRRVQRAVDKPHRPARTEETLSKEKRKP